MCINMTQSAMTRITIVLTFLLISGCNTKLKLSGSNETMTSCDRKFTYTAKLHNNTGEKIQQITCTANELTNVTINNPVQSGISLDIDTVQDINFSGDVKSECVSGYFEVKCKGINASLTHRYESQTLFVDVDHTTLIGKGPDGVTPDSNGNFEYDFSGKIQPWYLTEWSCCYPGGGTWKVKFDAGDPSVNVDSETADMQTKLDVKCPVAMNKGTKSAVPPTLKIRGNLTDKRIAGKVSLHADGDKANGDCRLFTEIEAAAPP